jgi:hypothetical protein
MASYVIRIILVELIMFIVITMYGTSLRRPCQTKIDRLAQGQCFAAATGAKAWTDDNVFRPFRAT